MRAAALCMALSAALAGAAGAQPTFVDPELALETVASNLAQPLGVAFVGPGDLLVLEKNTGRVRRFLGGVAQPDALDVAVSIGSERGLLGIAVNTLDPPQVFLYYTEATFDGGAPLGNRIYRYDWNPGSGTLENPFLIRDLPATQGPNHNGGILVLGPPGEVPPEIGGGDGALLYAVIGDLNRDHQLENFPAGAPPDDTAVVLRIRQDGAAAPGNPFAPYCSATTSQGCLIDGNCPGGETCITEVASYFAYGVRNSFGLALDPVTGWLWDTENGPSTYDEVNRLAPGTNSGWQQIMGPDARDPQGPGDLFDVPSAGGSTYSDPEFSWLSTIAPTAILFPFGSALGAAYDQVALVGDYTKNRIYAFPLNEERDAFDLADVPGLEDLVADSAEERDAVLLGEGFAGVVDLKLGPDRALYVVDFGSAFSPTGAVHRVSGPHRPVPALGAPARWLPWTALCLFAAAGVSALLRGRERAARRKRSQSR